MKYLCLCYYDTEALARLNPAEQQEIAKACAPHDAALRATGRLLVQGSLSSPESWSHFVPKNGMPVRSDGPYLKGTRQAGAFFIVEATSAEEARTVASKHAAANFGEHIGFAVEVRECELYQTY